MAESRRWQPLQCAFCSELPEFEVTETESSFGEEVMLVCEDHYYTAFS